MISFKNLQIKKYLEVFIFIMIKIYPFLIVFILFY